MVMSAKEKKAFVARMKKGKKDAAKGKTKSKGGGKSIKQLVKAKRKKTQLGIENQIKDMKKSGMTKTEIRKLLMRDTKIYIDNYL